MTIDWDSLTKEEYDNLHTVRTDTEKILSEMIMSFEELTGLEVNDIGMYRESQYIDVLEKDGTIRPGDENNISIQLLVPMRIMFPEDFE